MLQNARVHAKGGLMLKNVDFQNAARFKASSFDDYAWTGKVNQTVKSKKYNIIEFPDGVVAYLEVSTVGFRLKAAAEARSRLHVSGHSKCLRAMRR